MQNNTLLENKLPQRLPPRSVDEPIAVGPSTTESATLERWTVKPEVLVMDSCNKDNRISLVNLVQQDLK